VFHVAQKVVVELVDDLDGTASDDISTVTFGLDGVQYEIDLSDDNAGRLRDALGDYVGAARRTGGRIKRGIAHGNAAVRPAVDREQTKAIRDWARQNGFEMADRGRISTTVIEAFEQAQAAAAKPKTRKGRSKAKELAFSA
jgi:hypothetical protein